MRHSLRGPLNCSKSASCNFAPLSASSLADSPGRTRCLCCVVPRFVGSSAGHTRQHGPAAALPHCAKGKPIFAGGLCHRRQRSRGVSHLEDRPEGGRSCPAEASAQAPSGTDQSMGGESLEPVGVSACHPASSSTVDAPGVGRRRSRGFAQEIPARLQRRAHASVCLCGMARSHLWPLRRSTLDTVSRQMVDPHHVGHPGLDHRRARIRNLEVAARWEKGAGTECSAAARTDRRLSRSVRLDNALSNRNSRELRHTRTRRTSRWN